MVIELKGNKQKIVKLAPAVIMFFAILGVFVMSNKNIYGFYSFKNSTFYMLGNSLCKIKHSDYSSMNEGDTIYYYEKAQNGYLIKSDKLLFKGSTKTKPIYVISSKPDEVIPSERIIGKLALKSSVLGIFTKLFASKPMFFVFLILPLMFLMTYRFYNVMTVTSEKRFVKLNDNFVPLPKFKTRTQILTRSQRTAG